MSCWDFGRGIGEGRSEIASGVAVEGGAVPAGDVVVGGAWGWRRHPG